MHIIPQGRRLIYKIAYFQSEDLPPAIFGVGQLTKAEMLAIVKEQALNKQKKKEQPSRTFQEKIKFYATFTFSLIAITGFSVLMFLGSIETVDFNIIKSEI